MNALDYRSQQHLNMMIMPGRPFTEFARSVGQADWDPFIDDAEFQRAWAEYLDLFLEKDTVVWPSCRQRSTIGPPKPESTKAAAGFTPPYSVSITCSNFVTSTRLAECVCILPCPSIAQDHGALPPPVHLEARYVRPRSGPCVPKNPCPILNSVAQIEKPGSFAGEAKNVSELLEQMTNWHVSQAISAPDVHRRVWYRGHSDHTYILWPGVYRPQFTKAATKMYGKNKEDKRLNLEREMLSEFRTSGATLLNANNVTEVYFMAQHFGMPTRLLDWTMNPLAALFCAVKGPMKRKTASSSSWTRRGYCRLFPTARRAS